MATRTKKVTAVAKPAKAAKPPTRAHLQTEVSKLQTEVSSLKHPAHGTKKHDTTKAKKKHTASKKHSAARGVAIGDTVPCCAAEALAATLRLAGGLVTDDDVLALYWRTTTELNGGASILETLEAAAEYGLAGVRPARWGMAGRDSNPHTPIAGLRDVDLGPATRRLIPLRPPAIPAADGSSLILGLQLPGGPHAVTLDPSGLAWSWGELYSLDQLEAGPPEEAWVVSWQ